MREIIVTSRTLTLNMHILWIKSGPLMPLDTGGKIRSAHLYRGLAKQHKVSLFCYYDTFAGEDPHDVLREEFDEVFTLPMDLPQKGTLAEKLDFLKCALTSKEGYSQFRYNRKAVRARLREVVEHGDYDLLLCDFAQPASILPWDLAVPKVIFTHNVEGLIWKRQAEVSNSFLWKRVYAMEHERLTRVERTYLPRADHVLAVSGADKAVFSEYMPADDITVIPTGVDTDYFAPAEESPGPFDIVFTGSMDWMPNEAGVLWFCDKVLPGILEKVPEAKFWVVGRRPTQKLIDLGNNHPQVEVTGGVEDIRPYLARGAVYVVPILSGSGTRIKIFEAMAAGKAVVSTRVGAEGLPLTDGQDVVFADEPAAFAHSVVRLLGDEGERRALEVRARRLVEGNYSWPMVTRVLEECLAGVASGSGG